MNSKFIDLLEKCGCAETGKCNCEKSGKKCSGKCKTVKEDIKRFPIKKTDKKYRDSQDKNSCCGSMDGYLNQGNKLKCQGCGKSIPNPKAIKESESKAYEEGYEVGFTKGGKRADCPSDYTPEEKIQWKDGFKEGQYDRTTDYGKGIKEARKDDDDYGDWKYHDKKDRDLEKKAENKKCKSCGDTIKNGVFCVGCGTLNDKGEKKMAKLHKESKFERYLMEQEELQNHLFESVVAIDPSNKEGAKFLDQLGLDAYSLDPKTTTIALAKYFKNKKMSDDEIFKFLKGIGFLKINIEDVRTIFNINAMSNIPTGNGQDPRASRNN